MTRIPQRAHLAIAVLAVSLSAPAFGQDTDVTPGPLPSAIAPESVTADMLTGADVYSVEGADVGKVRDIVFTSAGEVDAAVISVGGFLGFGQHRVSIPVEDLMVIERVDVEGEMIVQVPLTKAQMKELPEYQVPVASTE